MKSVSKMNQYLIVTCIVDVQNDSCVRIYRLRV